jgi:chemotaxis protein CheY-P-specific phosphatase CheC
MAKTQTITTDDILVVLCNSVKSVLTKATIKPVNYSSMVQKINKTCLKPDLGCFVLFDGGFSGLVIINFSRQAALEIYRDYMLQMGMQEEELSTAHTSDDVADIMGELMNQIVGDFTGVIGHELHTSINQNQPKMLTINKQVMLSIDTNLDRPQARRVTFMTEKNNIFYLELAMDKTEFIKLPNFEARKAFNADDIIEEEANKAATQQAKDEIIAEPNQSEQDLLDELGI